MKSGEWSWLLLSILQDMVARINQESSYRGNRGRFGGWNSENFVRGNVGGRSWMDPMADLSLTELEKGIKTKESRIGSAHPGGFNAGMLDGSVRFFSEKTDKAVLRALGTRSGGERVSP